MICTLTLALQKVMQYSVRVYLLFHSTVGSSRLFANRKKTNWEIELVSRLTAFSSGLSTTRRVSSVFGGLSVVLT